jgi:hypothetical protein
MLQIFFECTFGFLLVVGDPEGFLGALNNWFEGMTQII